MLLCVIVAVVVTVVGVIVIVAFVVAVVVAVVCIVAGFSDVEVVFVVVVVFSDADVEVVVFVVVVVIIIVAFIVAVALAFIQQEVLPQEVVQLFSGKEQFPLLSFSFTHQTRVWLRSIYFICRRTDMEPGCCQDAGRTPVGQNTKFIKNNQKEKINSGMLSRSWSSLPTLRRPSILQTLTLICGRRSALFSSV